MQSQGMANTKFRSERPVNRDTSLAEAYIGPAPWALVVSRPPAGEKPQYVVIPANKVTYRWFSLGVYGDKNQAHRRRRFFETGR